MQTPYSEDNQKFSDKAHIYAQELIYPCIFKLPKSRMEFQTTSLIIGEKEKILDGEMAIDRIVKVTDIQFRETINFTVQERFRRKQYAKYRDITITEWNNETNQKSELYKLNCGIFVYGYFDDINLVFIDWVAVNTVDLLHWLVSSNKYIETKTNPRSNQTFITISFYILENNNLIIAKKTNIEEAIQ